MNTKHHNISLKANLLPDTEVEARIARTAKIMEESSVEAMLLSDYANLYYLTGRVFAGYIYLIISSGRPSMYIFVRRPLNLEDVTSQIRKPEEVPSKLAEIKDFIHPKNLGLEYELTTYSDIQRLQKAFGLGSAEAPEFVNASGIMRQVRAVKTDFEVAKLRLSGERHAYVYSQIPKYFREGMTDIELQIEIERALRLEGSLGQFRVSGTSMEIFMGSLIVGDNADNLSPYDFAMGGAGLDPSLPVGANGELIRPGTTVMVDLGGDFNGYMTDLSRVFSFGELPDKAKRAHDCSLEIHRKAIETAAPGMAAKELYNLAAKIAKDWDLEDYFMGHCHHAPFVGHGVGIEINELPVLAPRSKDILREGNVIAYEPKFVLPHIGAVGIENTYWLNRQGKLENLTPAKEAIIPLD